MLTVSLGRSRNDDGSKLLPPSVLPSNSRLLFTYSKLFEGDLLQPPPQVVLPADLHGHFGPVCREHPLVPDRGGPHGVVVGSVCGREGVARGGVEDGAIGGRGGDVEANAGVLFERSSRAP